MDCGNCEKILKERKKRMKERMKERKICIE